MSYTLTVVVPPVRSEDGEAWESLEELAGLTGARPQVLQTLHDRLVARFPCISTLPDDEVDGGAWSDGPLIDDFGHRVATLGILRVEEVLPFLLETANDLGLTVFDPQDRRIHRPGAGGRASRPARHPGSMGKADVTRLLRQELDPAMKALGFRWTRGTYLRAWDGGYDGFGWGLASHGARHVVGGFATVRLDAVEELVTPHVPYAKPEHGKQAWSINVNALSAFEDGPETPQRDAIEVENEQQVRAVATRRAALARERIDPFWRSIRAPADLWRLPVAWRRFWPGPRQMHEVALAFLCALVPDQRRIEAEALGAFPPGDMHRHWIESLVADLRRRRGDG